MMIVAEASKGNLGNKTLPYCTVFTCGEATHFGSAMIALTLAKEPANWVKCNPNAKLNAMEMKMQMQCTPICNEGVSFLKSSPYEGARSSRGSVG